MGGDIPKQFLPVCGKPVLMRTLEAFHAYDATMHIILVLPLSQQAYWKELCQEYGEKYALQLIGEKYPGRTGYDGEIIAENYTNDYFTLNEKGLFLAKTPFYSISQADYRVRNSTDCFGCGAHVDRGDNYHCPWCGQLQEELETMEGVWENEIVGMW